MSSCREHVRNALYRGSYGNSDEDWETRTADITIGAVNSWMRQEANRLDVEGRFGDASVMWTAANKIISNLEPT